MPFALDLSPDVRSSLSDSGDIISLEMRRQVDPGRLEAVYRRQTEHKGESNEVKPLRLKVSDDSMESLLAQDLVAALTFLTSVPIVLERLTGADRFVPENESDADILSALGTDLADQGITLLISANTFKARVTQENVKAVMTRSAGIRIYRDAMLGTLSSSRYRDLWRILESAFGAINDRLVSLLADYPPALQLDFDEAELKQLLVLRGRASHAQSRAGIEELLTVERLCADSLPRLTSLVQRVILTKSVWNSKSKAIDELTPLQAYANKKGGVTFVVKPNPVG